MVMAAILTVFQFPVNYFGLTCQSEVYRLKYMLIYVFNEETK